LVCMSARRKALKPPVISTLNFRVQGLHRQRFVGEYLNFQPMPAALGVGFFIRRRAALPNGALDQDRPRP
jgi:hypothetical protein